MQPTNYTEQLLGILEGAIAQIGGTVPPPQQPANLDERMLTLLHALSAHLSQVLSSKQPLDDDLVAIAQQGTTAYGRSLLLLSSLAALQSALGLGALAYLNTVTTSQLSDGAVTDAKLAADSVTTSKLANAAVTLGKLQAIAHQRLLGNNSGSSAAPSEISFTATGLSLLQAVDAAAARTAIAAVDDTHQNQTVGPSLHGLGANVRVLGNRNAAGEYIQRGSVTGQSSSTSFSPSLIQQISVSFPSAFSSAPQVYVNCLAGRPACAVSVSATGFTVWVFDNAASADRTITYLAIGS